MSAYVPGVVPTDPKDIPAFLKQELDKIATAMRSPNENLQLTELHVAPNKYRDGFVILADGTDYDPGAGAGFYGYRGGAWVLLG